VTTTTKSTRPHLSGDEIAWAFVVGVGLLLVMLALGISAAQGSDSTGTLAILEAIGFLFIIGGSLGWALEFRPWKNFDDLKTPLYTGHAHDDHHAPSTETTAEHSESAVEHHE
jgi:hypothetical protein